MTKQQIDKVMSILNEDVHAVGILKEFNKLAEQGGLTKEQYGTMLGKLAFKLASVHPVASQYL